MLLRLVFLLLSIRSFFVKDVRYFKVNCTSMINESENANKDNKGSIPSGENSQFENDVTSKPETIGPLRKSPKSFWSTFFTKNQLNCISTVGNTDVPTPEKKITFNEEYIKKTINNLRKGKTLNHQKLEILLNKAADLLKKEETIVSVQVPTDGKLVIIGDLNGRFKDFISIIRFFGVFPNDKLYFLFNGDLVDEGGNGSEILISVLLLKLRFPKYVFLNRGHQEDYCPFIYSTFNSEMREKYNETFYEKIITDVFPAFPIAHKINDKIFIVHGGIPFYEDLDLNEFNTKFQRTEFKMVYSDKPLPFEEIEGNSSSADSESKNELTRIQYAYGLIDFLWSDPYDGSMKFKKGHRGMYHTLFNFTATDNFFKKNKLSLLIRSHEASDDGYFFFHDKKGLTIHSCPNYKSKIKNYGSVAVFSQNSESIEIFQFKSNFTSHGEFNYFVNSDLRCDCATEKKLFQDKYKKGGSIFCKCSVKLAETFQVKTVEYPQNKSEQDELTQ